MGIFKDGPELKQEGRVFLDAKDYTRALRCFEKAYEKNDNESILLIYKTYKHMNQVEKGIAAIEACIDDDRFSIPEQIKMCMTLAENRHLNEKYLDKAANLGDVVAQGTLFTRVSSTTDQDAVLHYGELILSNTAAGDELKASVIHEFLNRVTQETSLGNNCYAMANHSIGPYSYLALLEQAIVHPGASSKLRNGAKLSLSRFYLVNHFCQYVENDTEHYYEVYNSLAKCDVDVLSLLHDIAPEIELARFYLAVIYTFGLGIVKPDYKKAYSLIHPLSEIQRYSADKTKPGSRQFVSLLNAHAISGLESYILYSGEWSSFEEIIGNEVFKKEISNQLAVLDRQYNRWDGTSDFSALVRKSRIVDPHLWIFDGGPSNAKRTLAQVYGKQLAYHCFKNCDFRIIDPFEINAIYFPDKKFEYLRSFVEGIKPNECRVLYFEAPYLVNKTNNDFDGVNSVLRFLTRMIDSQSKDTIVLIFGGDGDRIRNDLIAADVPEYKFKRIRFHGYSPEDAIKLLKNLVNNDAKFGGERIELGEEIFRKVQHIISLKNSSSDRNVNHDEISFIYRCLKNAYYQTSPGHSPEYNLSFEHIERELGIHQQEESDFNKAMKELDEMIGLSNIKAKMRNIIGSVIINDMRKQNGLKPINNSLHMVFSGNPGTGKTTVAKMMGKILKELNVLSRGHVVEVSRSDLVDIYFGGTAHKTRTVLNRALNGVLFIDEAYTLTNNAQSGGMKDYGIEAVEEILKFMSDHNNEIVVIVAGYKQEMKDFIATNPGLQSRFNTWVEFEDYTEDELYAIFEGLCNKNDFKAKDAIKPYILADFKKAKTSGSNFGNARYVNTYFNELVEKLGNYLNLRYNASSGVIPTKEELQTFTEVLFDDGTSHSEEFTFADFFAR